MIFNSLRYLGFFSVVFVLYYVLPHKWRNTFLVLASFTFYMSWKPIFGVLLLLMILVAWISARMISRLQGIRAKKQLVSLSVVILLMPLALFKYMPFFTEQLNILFSFLAPINPIQMNWPDLLLPIGISFYSFQAIGYVIDVYRKDVKPLSLYQTTVFLSFFPQLNAGPIGRTRQMVPQFTKPHKLNYDDFSHGLAVFLIGLFKKTVVADRLALYVSTAYGNIEHHSGMTLLMASCFFAIQLYCDFSGYSDMAVGSGRMLGFQLTTNFRRPYFATSVRFFWSRWHVSLTSWFRDYLFVPIYKSLLGKKKILSAPKTAVITVFVFLVSGLWHGAGWTFIVWGVLNGLFLAIEPVLLKRWFHVERHLSKNKFLAWLNNMVKILLVFASMTFCFVFFRADSMQDAFSILQRIATQFPGFYKGDTAVFFYCLLSILMLFVVDLYEEKTNKFGGILLAKSPLATAFRMAAMLVIIVLIGIHDASQFIYFQF